MNVYHLQITLLDRSSPNSSRRILRGSPSIRSAGRTPHPTATGLPGKLDFQIADAPTYIPRSPSGFWEDFSQAPTTRLGERWDQLPDAPHLSPTAYWYEPDSIIPREHTAPSTFTPAPTLDYRFGPIAVDWIDNPSSHPAFGKPSDSSKPSYHSSGAIPPETANPAPKDSMRYDQSASSRKIEKSASSISSPSLPTGRFVADVSGQGKDRYQLGSTDLGYGSIHLYRDLEEAAAGMRTDKASTEAEEPGLATATSSGWTKQTSKMTSQKQVLEPETRSEEDIQGTVIAVLAIPSYMTAQGQ